MYVNDKIIIPLGNDVSLPFIPTDVVDITGWTITFTVVSRLPQTNTALLTKTLGDGVTVTNAPGGDFTVSLSSADIQSLGSGQFYYAVTRTNAGFTDEIASGIMDVSSTAKRY